MRFQLLDVGEDVHNGRSIVLLIGRRSSNESDCSVCIRVTGFHHFIYIPGSDITDPLDDINNYLAGPDARRTSEGDLVNPPVASTEAVERTDVHGFQPAGRYWKVTLYNHRHVKQLRDAINCGNVNGIVSRRTYLTDFPYEMLAQIQMDISICGWVHIGDSWLSQAPIPLSICQSEYIVPFTEIRPCTDAESIAEPPRLRVLSFDIEVAGRYGCFPDPAVDPIIQISSVVKQQGTDAILSFGILTWKTATPLPETCVFEGTLPTYTLCMNETDMVNKWLQLIVRGVDVDVITGWNTDDFDLSYITRRASRLPGKPSVSSISRIIGSRVYAENSNFSSKAFGSRDSYKLKGVTGRLFNDMYVDVLRGMVRYRSYKMDYIARTVLAHQNAFEFIVPSGFDGAIHSVEFRGVGSKPIGLLPCVLFPDGLDPLVEKQAYRVVGSSDGACCVRLRFNRSVKSTYILLRLIRSDGSAWDYITCDRASDEHKEDVHHTKITGLWNGSDDDRQRLAIYNLVDAILPLKIMWRLRALVNNVQMAAVTGINLTMLLQRGQGVKTVMLLQRYCHKNGYIVPYFPPRIKLRLAKAEAYDESLWFSHGMDAAADAELNGGGDGEETTAEGDEDAATTTIKKGKGDTKFEGGYVGRMKKESKAMTSYYGNDEPIATVDFSSLYPSIMMTWNLCFSTLIRDVPAFLASGHSLETDAERTPINVYFVKRHLRHGILPMILDTILAARKSAKNAAESELDPGRKASYDARQLALKITANSIYGFTGCTTGKMPCMEVGASVTAYGRTEIRDFVQPLVERNFPGSNVIYGDTDSLFVRFANTVTIQEAICVGKEACALVNAQYKLRDAATRMSLAFEKIMCPFLGVSDAKRYAGLYWTRADEPDMIYVRGIETVRRDACLLVSETMNAVLFLILWEGDVESAMELIRLVVGKIWMCQMPFEKFVMAKEYKQENYKNAQPHAEVVKKMRKRDPSTAPKIGDRVPYIIAPHDTKKTNVSDASEDPDYCKKNDIYPSQSWYIETLQGSLSRIMVPIIGEEATNTLFHGDHTRRRKTILPKIGGLMSFIKRGDEALAINSAAAEAEAESHKRRLLPQASAAEEEEAESKKKKKKTGGGGQQQQVGIMRFFQPLNRQPPPPQS